MSSLALTSPIHQHLHFLFFLLTTHLLQTIQSGIPCDFDPDSKSKWRQCECERLTVDTSKAYCRHLAWLTIPTLPSPGAAKFHATSLSIVESGLIFLPPDAFRGQNIQLLDLNHNQIETINNHAFRGLESKLYQLSLNHNALTRVPSKQVTALQQLQYLYLRHNRIDDLDATTFHATQLRSLRFLHLDYNLLSTIPAHTFTQLRLQVLTLGNNRLTYVDDDAFPSTLTYLSLKNNLLNSIPFDALQTLGKTLDTLDLDGNNITQLTGYVDLNFEKNFTLTLSNNLLARLPPASFSSFRYLVQLDLSYNKLEYLHPEFLRGIKVLEHLDLSNNRLIGIPRGAFADVGSSLRRLILEENELKSLPDAFETLTSLNLLNLKSNKLEVLNNELLVGFKGQLKELLLSFNALTQVPTDVLEGMMKLEHLDLSKNRILNLSRLAFGKFNGIGTNLVRLNLAGNRIRSLDEPGAFLYMSALAYLDLSHNQIAKIHDDAFNLLPGLESLFLHNNQLVVLPSSALKKLPKLRYLVLDNNDILAIPSASLDGFYALERLSLAHNRLQAIGMNTFNPTTMKKLRSLNLANNRISYAASQAFANLTSIESLFLQGNSLTNLNARTFMQMPNLKTIYLDRNAINRSMDEAFYDLPRLEYLSLRHNRLREISVGVFSGVPNLEFLDLSHNELDLVDDDFLSNLQNLKSLDLGYNKLEKHFGVHQFSNTLERLVLRGNRITQLNDGQFAEFPKLTYLDLSHNYILDLHPKTFSDSNLIAELSLSYNYLNVIKKSTFNFADNLRLLDLSHNRLQRLEHSCFGENNLEHLDLSFNQLESVQIGSLNTLHQSLSYLNLDSNKISSLESKFYDGLRNLSTLYLNRNQILRIEEAAFKGIHRLRDLDLSENPIVDWNSNAFRDLGHSIESVNLASTGLYSLPKLGQRAIRSLNLSGNRMDEFDATDFQQLTKLESLDLSGNRLSSLPRSIFQGLLNLKYLNISRNPLYLIDSDTFKSMQKLEVLTFHDLPNLARFDSSSLRSLRNLKELRMHSYRDQLIDTLNITYVLENLPPLTNLQIDISNETLDHQLSQIDSRFLRNLKIGGNRLRKISNHAFETLRGYRVSLSIRHTQLAYFSPWIYLALNHVTYLELDLSDNRLETFDPFPTSQAPILNDQGTMLADLDLRNNPLICDCRLKWTKVWLEYLERVLPPDEFRTKFELWNETYCYFGADRKKVAVARLDFRNMLRCYSNGAAGVGSWAFLGVVVNTVLMLGWVKRLDGWR